VWRKGRDMGAHMGEMQRLEGRARNLARGSE